MTSFFVSTFQLLLMERAKFVSKINAAKFEKMTPIFVIFLPNRLWQISSSMFSFSCIKQWKGINRKKSTRWQHLSQLKASAFFSLQKIFSCYKTQQLILGSLGLVLPSGGWQSLIDSRCFYFLSFSKIATL